MDMASVKFFSMAVATVVITGCGGGGGGGSASSPTQLSLDTQGFGDKKASLRVQSDFEDATAAYSEINDVVSLIEDVEVSLQAPSGDTAVATAAAAEPEYSCANPEGVVNVQQSVGASSESYVFTFSNCQVQTFNHGLLSLNGEYRTDVTASSSGSSGTIVQQIDISGQKLDSGDALAILGSQTTTFNAINDSITMTTVSPSMEYRLGDEYVATRDSEFKVTESADVITLSMKIDLVSSALAGYVSYSTPTPIEVVWAEDCPIKGHILLEGDGTVEARYGQSTGRGFGLEVLVNGSEVSYYDTCSAALPL